MMSLPRAWRAAITGSNNSICCLGFMHSGRDLTLPMQALNISVATARLRTASQQ